MAGSASAAIRFRCPQCTTLLGARRKYAGKERRCPCCFAVFQVPTAEELEARDARIQATGSYDMVMAGEGEAAQKTYIPVNCPVCRSSLYATPDEVGSELVCSDCDSKVVVPPLETMPAEPTLSEEELAKRQDEYSLLDEDHRPSHQLKQLDQPYIALKCSLCGTRLLATQDQVGQKIFCPDCNRRTLVRAPAAPPSQPDTDRTQEYQSGAMPEDRDYTPLLEDALRRGEQRLKEEDQMMERPESEPLRSRKPPRGLFRSGIIGFLFYPGVLSRWIVLTSCLIGLTLMVSGGVYLMSRTSVTIYFLGLAVVALSLVLAGAFLPMIATALLAIVQDTGEGNDNIENWPDASWIDAVLESLYILNSLAISGLPGIMIASILRVPLTAYVLIAHTSAMLLFPAALMGALDSGSPFTPFSLAVLRGIPSTWRGWIRFYFVSALLFAAFIAVTYFAPVYGGFLGATLVAALFVPVLFLYFRLLGRLALFCSDTSVGEDGSARDEPFEPEELPYERFIKDED